MHAQIKHWFVCYSYYLFLLFFSHLNFFSPLPYLICCHRCNHHESQVSDIQLSPCLGNQLCLIFVQPCWLFSGHGDHDCALQFDSDKCEKERLWLVGSQKRRGMKGWISCHWLSIQITLLQWSNGSWVALTWHVVRVRF